MTDGLQNTDVRGMGRILTITMNPSIDISYPLESLEINTVNRPVSTLKTPGGKGLNVTRVLAQLGEEVVSSGLLGGKHGEFIEAQLDKIPIKHSFYHIDGETRNCIAILHDGNQTEILEKGPEVSKSDAQGFLEYFSSMVSEYSLVTISGSLPRGVDLRYYAEMVSICKQNDVPVVLDCSGEPLRMALNHQYKPTVIKPNVEELAQLLQMPVTQDLNSIRNALVNPIFDNVEWVIVSLGPKGAFAKHADKFYQISIPKISVVNPVGSGDSMVAGLACGIVGNLEDKELLIKANVLGMLNAQEKLTGHVNLANFDALAKQVDVKEVD